MSAAVREMVVRLLTTVCAMWIWDTRGELLDGKFTKWLTVFVYPRDLWFKDTRLVGHRIRIVFDILPWDEIVAEIQQGHPSRGSAEEGRIE